MLHITSVLQTGTSSLFHIQWVVPFLQNRGDIPMFHILWNSCKLFVITSVVRSVIFQWLCDHVHACLCVPCSHVQSLNSSSDLEVYINEVVCIYFQCLRIQRLLNIWVLWAVHIHHLIYVRNLCMWNLIHWWEECPELLTSQYLCLLQ